MTVVVQLQKAGKIRYVGLSNFSVAEMERAMAVAPIVSFQGLYNLLERNAATYHAIPLEYQVEREILLFCREHGLAFFPYSPLFQGLLTGAFQASDNFDQRDVRAANPKLGGDVFATYFEIVGKLTDFAQEIGRPLNQVAINWLINQDAVTSVICGAQNADHVEQNVASVTWDLTEDMMVRIERTLEPFAALVFG